MLAAVGIFIHYHHHHHYYYYYNHNYNKTVKSDWLSTDLISALIGQLIGQYASCLSNWTVRAITRALKWLFFSLLAKNISEFLVF